MAIFAHKIVPAVGSIASAVADSIALAVGGSIALAVPGRLASLVPVAGSRTALPVLVFCKVSFFQINPHHIRIYILRCNDRTDIA